MNLSDLKIECGKKGFNLSDSQIEQFETYIKLLQVSPLKLVDTL